jgi:hypothetical protein
MTQRAIHSLFLLLFLACGTAAAQDMNDVLNNLTTPATDYASATFKATRVINGQSVEQMKEGQLDFRIHHRFGPVNSGAYELWGLDQSNIFLGLEYGLTDWFGVGVGRSSYQKTYNGSAKFRLMRQSTGEKNNVASISLFTGVDCFTTDWADQTVKHYFADRLSYTMQALIARKFTEDLSLQVSPTIVHRNLVPTLLDNHDVYAVGFGGRYKISTRVSVNAEYFLAILPSVEGRTNNPNSFSVGVDIETGGHVFQIMLTNSLAMIERGFIAENSEKWNDGGIHLGFNISRVFTLL